MRFIVFIYSRLSSTRLPRKALKMIGKNTLVGTVIKNLTFLDPSIPRVLLTSTQEDDDLLVEIAEEHNILWHRGSLNDVSQRTVSAINQFQPSYFIRINGDCPIQLKNLIQTGLNSVDNADIVSNIVNRTYNYGLSFEMVKSKTFLKFQPFFSKKEQEHITRYFYNKQNSFRINSIECEQNYFKRGPSLSVDDNESYIYVKKVLRQFPDIGKDDIHELNKKLKNLE